MTQKCLKCLKFIMCAVNFLCFVTGATVLGFGVYMIRFEASSLLPSLGTFTVSNLLLISGIIITCIAFLGFIGALKENRCLLLTFFLLLLVLMLVELAAACLLLVYDDAIAGKLENELNQSLENAKNSTNMKGDWDLVQETFHCCGVHNWTDWGNNAPNSCCQTHPCSDSQYRYHDKGCLSVLKNWFDQNFITTGVSVIILCVIEVLGMCFSMTLFCHISRSGLGYKL
ncbi:hypothetical protein NHX12_016734 [Muraenolepis orangiensis]|uniref:Tetraspanin n=1 Tax=Muraenolepis orangiensis TaxID=630683 RepID=A0A9Q0D479_9TELE|nr:hypothetical protein NHX12_016734 [Muraenolepis orangiensis]